MLIGNLQRERLFRLGRRRIGGKIIGYRLLFINTQKACVCPDKAFVEDTARESIELFPLQGFQMATHDPGGSGYFIQSNTSHLSFSPQPVTKRTHDISL